MRIVLLILMLIIGINIDSFSQDELRSVEVSNQYLWHTLSPKELSKYYFGSNLMEESIPYFHFRYEKEGQIIDLTSKNGDEFEGQILNHIIKYKKIKSEFGKILQRSNYIFEVKELDSLSSTSIGRYLLESQYYKIPTDSLISNWNSSSFHCDKINFICKIRDSTFSSSFTCYLGQADSVKYSNRILEFNNRLERELKLKDVYSKFVRKLKTGKTYSSDGYMFRYVKTEEQRRNWIKDKPRRDYLKSISDTITNNIEKQLNSLISKEQISTCYDDFQIVFSKNGKFKKLKTYLNWKERLFDKDYRQCRKILKPALKKITVDFVTPKYEFYRTVFFNKDSIRVHDRTPY